jgi:cytoskeletal protein CcmA (bactofilin family)
MASTKHGDFSINTIIGPGTSVSGDIESGGFTRIDGNVRGNLRAKGMVVIGERARMKSNITGSSVTIGGVVFGDVFASEHLVILATGLVLGNIITRRIQADEGCLIHGRVRLCSTDEAWNLAMSEYRDATKVRETYAFAGAGSSFAKPAFPQNNLEHLRSYG